MIEVIPKSKEFIKKKNNIKNKKRGPTVSVEPAGPQGEDSSHPFPLF
jgi:hypothetical protein